MHSNSQSWARIFQRIVNVLLIIPLCIFLVIEPVFALNDGQQLVLEAWQLVNEGYLNPAKFDEIHWF